MALQLNDADYGAVPSVANPIRFSESPVQYKNAPPGLGADSREILAELGYDEEVIEAFFGGGIVG